MQTILLVAGVFVTMFAITFFCFFVSGTAIPVAIVKSALIGALPLAGGYLMLLGMSRLVR